LGHHFDKTATKGYPMKNSLLFSITLLAGFALTPAAVTVTTGVGDTFSPDSINVTSANDTVIFTLASIHNVVEVSQATYNQGPGSAAGTTPLSGGFTSVPFGGGKLTGVTVGTHYFVCTNHASMGMKGKLIVAQSTAINPVSNKSSNPFTFQIAGSAPILLSMPGASARISIVNLQGKTVWSRTVQKNAVQKLTWDRKLSNGNSVAAGNYFVRVLEKSRQKPIYIASS
jgi:plastocyanin